MMSSRDGLGSFGSMRSPFPVSENKKRETVLRASLFELLLEGHVENVIVLAGFEPDEVRLVVDQRIEGFLAEGQREQLVVIVPRLDVDGSEGHGRTANGPGKVD